MTLHSIPNCAWCGLLVVGVDDLICDMHTQCYESIDEGEGE